MIRLLQLKLQYDLEESASTQTLKLAYSDLAIKELRDYAVQQNLMTLRNRVNELGVSEPSCSKARCKSNCSGTSRSTGYNFCKKIIGKTAQFRVSFRKLDQKLQG